MAKYTKIEQMVHEMFALTTKLFKIGAFLTHLIIQRDLS